jgi:hypothetical protein
LWGEVFELIFVFARVRLEGEGGEDDEEGVDGEDGRAGREVSGWIMALVVVVVVVGMHGSSQGLSAAGFSPGPAVFETRLVNLEPSLLVTQ